MPRIPRASTLALAVLTAACLAPAAASAAPSWLAPRVVGGQNLSFAPSAALTPDGGAAVAWQQRNGDLPSTIWAATRERGGDWGRAVRLDAASGATSSPQVVSDPSGRGAGRRAGSGSRRRRSAGRPTRASASRPGRMAR